MNVFWIIVAVLASFALLALIAAYICFYLSFYSPRDLKEEEFSIPPGKIYEPHRDTMLAWMKEVRAMPHKEFCITSFDGLTLKAKYYEYSSDAPIELMFHGYRGNSERDLCGGVQRCFALERNAFIVDQRACGKSEGNIITFGINERHDCLSWVNLIIEHFGDDVKIILTGISMGAATVMMASDMELPKNVVGILADCGYTSAKEIIKKVMKQMKLPADLLYPFVRLGARLYGKFDPNETSPIKALKKCRVPAMFIHGESDDFVPCEMTERNYEACIAPKKMLTVPKAGHGLSYIIDREGYLKAVKEFDKEYGL